jgi:hypothetical protein
MVFQGGTSDQMADSDFLYPCSACRTIYEVAITCGHLPILFAKYASKRFLLLMAMIGLPTGE